MPRQPDDTTRLLSHALVAGAIGMLVGKQTSPLEGMMAAIVATIAHKEFDAPVAQWLAELGI